MGSSAKLKAVVSTAEQNGTRVLSIIHQGRRERGRRDAAAVEAKKKGVAKSLFACRDAVGGAGSPQIQAQSSGDSLAASAGAEVLRKTLDYILAELLRLCGDAAVEAKDFFVEPVHITTTVMRDDELSILFPEALLRRAESMWKKTKKIEDKQATHWYKAIPVVLKRLHSDLGIADSGRMMISCMLARLFERYSQGACLRESDMRIALRYELPAKISRHCLEEAELPHHGKVGSERRCSSDRQSDDDRIARLAELETLTIEGASARASSQTPSANNSASAPRAITGVASLGQDVKSEEAGKRDSVVQSEPEHVEPSAAG